MGGRYGVKGGTEKVVENPLTPQTRARAGEAKGVMTTVVLSAILSLRRPGKEKSKQATYPATHERRDLLG